jgi:hypothetical protein
MTVRIEVTCAADSKAHAENMLKALGIIQVGPQGDWIPLIEAHITHGIAIEGVSAYHFDILYYGQAALNLLREVPEGGWGPEHDLFERTTIIETATARTGGAVVPQWTATKAPIPPGYEAGGVRMFDPAIIGSRSHGFA